MRVLPISFSILNAWSRGNYDDAINMLFKLKELDTPQIRAGRAFDEAWTEEIESTGKLPQIFGAGELLNPRPQLYLRAKLSDWLELRGKIDNYDELFGGRITEFKSGISDATQIIDSHQTPTYAILCSFNNLPAARIDVHCHNQYTKRNTFAFAWVSDSMVRRTANWIETTGAEIYDYLETNNLWHLGDKNV